MDTSDGEWSSQIIIKQRCNSFHAVWTKWKGTGKGKCLSVYLCCSEHSIALHMRLQISDGWCELHHIVWWYPFYSILFRFIHSFIRIVSCFYNVATLDEIGMSCNMYDKCLMEDLINVSPATHSWITAFWDSNETVCYDQRLCASWRKNISLNNRNILLAVLVLHTLRLSDGILQILWLHVQFRCCIDRMRFRSPSALCLARLCKDSDMH